MDDADCKIEDNGPAHAHLFRPLTIQLVGQKVVEKVTTVYSKTKKAASFPCEFVYRSRGVMILALESILESDFHHFSEIEDSDSDANSNKNLFLDCSKNWIFIMAVIPIPIPIPTKTES